MPFTVDEERIDSLAPGDVYIRVAGVGDFGCSALNGMLDWQRNNVEFMALDTDPHSLLDSRAFVKIRLGGEGAAERKQATTLPGKPRPKPPVSEEERDAIARHLKGAHVVVILAGMGREAGSLIAPQLALIAKNMGILTIAVAASPFACEGSSSLAAAEKGISELRKYADTLILLDNERALRPKSGGATVTAAFEMANVFLCDTTKAIVDILTHRGYIRPGFGEVAGLLSKGGEAAIATARATGEESALRAVTEAVKTILSDNDALRHA